MYCILVTGIPASGKTALAEYLSASLHIPLVSKDKIKEILFDTIGFRSRTEKVGLGTGAMETMYYFAGQMMRTGQPFLLENNFENVSRPGIQSLLEEYGYQAVTVRLTGDYNVLFKRMTERNNSPDRHKGHIVNDCYQKPEINPKTKPKTKPEANPETNPETNPEINIQPVLTQEEFIRGITERGMVEFRLPGPVMEIDTTDFSKVDLRHVTEELQNIISSLKLQR